MSMIDKYHEAVAVTQSPLQKKLWRLTLFFWSLPQYWEGAASLILNPLHIFGGIILQCTVFGRFYKQLCTVGLKVLSQELKSQLQTPHGFKTPLLIPNSTGSRKVPWPLGLNPCWQLQLKFWAHTNSLWEALSKRHHSSMCRIPKSVHLLSTPLPGWSWTESLSLSYMAGVLKVQSSPAPQESAPSLLPTALVGDCSFHSPSFSMTTKISISPTVECIQGTQGAWYMCTCICTSFSDILVQ